MKSAIVFLLLVAFTISCNTGTKTKSKPEQEGDKSGVITATTKVSIKEEKFYINENQHSKAEPGMEFRLKDFFQIRVWCRVFLMI